MNRVKRTLALLLVTAVLCSGVFFPAGAEAKTAQSEKVLRVGLMLQYGFCDLDDNGQITGYIYEYLMRLSQRVGWKYDFIVYDASTNEEMQKALDMLKNGELDLMGAMVYNESTAAEYEFCMVPYGYSNYVLLTREDNDALSPRTFERTKNVRVAVSKNSPVQNEQFEAYCKRNNRKFTKVYTETYQEAKDLVINGEADVFIGKDVTKNTGYKAVLRFAEQPFYFAAAKGNTELTEQLDALI
ncbi:MAG: transporter substrate-binding domain-containing protein, partial [Oscillospiraceae bacterium]